MSDQTDQILQAFFDARGPDKWLRLAGILSAEQLESLLDGQLNAMIIIDHEFERRFPKEHAIWTAKHESD